MNKSYFVTVIGTRMPTAYGRMATDRIIRELLAEPIVIISGLARGIDAVAHRAALKAGGLTIAVVGCGPDLAYPPEHAGLMEEIAACGLVISEHPPGTMPLRQHFPARNRILSGLADAVAVMEASGDSGTMITAGFAGDQGRDVFAVPGSIFSPYSQGCNQLIRDGAGVLESAQDILWRLPSGSIQTRLEQAIRQQMPQDLDSATDPGPETENETQRLRRVLFGHPLTLAEIACQMELTVADTAVMLTAHELEGNVQCERSRYSLTEKAIFCI